jgi:hypothetical protein
MADQNLAVDICIKDELGNSAMWHARGTTPAMFAENLAALVQQQPQLAAFVFGGHVGVALTSPSAPAAATRAIPPGQRIESVCPTHQTAKASQFGGMFCPGVDESQRNGRCAWTSGKPAATRAA